MAIGALVTACVVVLGVVLNPLDYADDADTQLRVELAATACLAPALFLTVAIGRLAKHRFFTPEDIDGGGLSVGSDRARVLQSLLQNTLEQALLATLAYASWSLLMPGSWLSVVGLAAICFALGRIAFFAGYVRGAPSRSLGFTLTFYPSIVMLAVLLGHGLWSRLGW